MMQKPTLKMHYVLFVPSRKKTFLNNENLKKLQKVFFFQKRCQEETDKVDKICKKIFSFFQRKQAKN